MRTWILITGLALAGVAAAQEVEVDPVTGERFQFPERTILDMDGVELHGALVGPHIQPVTEQRAMRFDVMFPVRTNFERELRSTGDEVR